MLYPNDRDNYWDYHSQVLTINCMLMALDHIPMSEKPSLYYKT